MGIHELVRQMNEAFCKTNGLYEQWARDKGIQYNAMMVLYHIDQYKKVTQKEICSAWLLPKQTVNSILTDYKKKGYVLFEADSKDKREKRISFTSAGQDYANTILPPLYKIEQRVLERMGKELCEQFIRGEQLYCKYFEEEVNHE